MRCTSYKAKYFPSRLMDITEAGFLSNLLYPILFQLLMSQTAVTALSPVSKKKSISHSIRLLELDKCISSETIHTFLDSTKQKWFSPVLRESTKLNFLILNNQSKHDVQSLRECNKHKSTKSG